MPPLLEYAKRRLSHLLPPPPTRALRTLARLIAGGLIVYVALSVLAAAFAVTLAGAVAAGLYLWSRRSPPDQP